MSDIIFQVSLCHKTQTYSCSPPPYITFPMGSFCPLLHSLKNSVVNALNREGKKKILTEFGEMLPGCRPMQAKVFASSAEFTPQFGATFAWHRMWTFILQTDQGNGKEKQRTIKITWRGLLLRFNLLISIY